MTVLLVGVLLGAVTTAPAAAATRTVPEGWLGVVVDGALIGTDAARYEGEFDRMAAAGVESVRTAFYWNEVQPYPDAATVPQGQGGSLRSVAGVPTDFSRLDQFVAAAAKRRLKVLPVVHRTPAWAALSPNDLASGPTDETAYAAFLTALVKRYGPRGSLWRERKGLPRVPIRDWQIWNEPDLLGYWNVQPFAPTFVPLLRRADRALKAADPGSRTILAGLTNRSFISLRRIYQAGGRGSFDAVALHPYTDKPRDVVRLVELSRAEMNRRGDRRLPVWVTELSWPAALGKVRSPRGFETTDRGQVIRMREGIRLLAAARRRLRIERVMWYTWLSSARGENVFEYAGLRRESSGRFVSAPSLAEYQRIARRLEGCVKARGNASRCR